MVKISTSVSVSLGAGRSVNINYQYSRTALNLLQQINRNDTASIKNHYNDLPRTLKRIPHHLLGISSELGAVDKAIKWFSGLDAPDQRKQAEYWNDLPKAMKDVYKNNINILVQQKTIIASSVAAAAAAAAAASQGKNKRGRILGSKNKTPRRKKSNTGDNVIASIISPGYTNDNNNNNNLMTKGTPASTRHSLTGT